MRGVDVRIVTPFIPDKKINPTHHKRGLSGFVVSRSEDFEYSPGFIHSKQILVDKDFAAVGTINLDYRSLLHHYENAVCYIKRHQSQRFKKILRRFFSISRNFPSYDKNSWYQN